MCFEKAVKAKPKARDKGTYFMRTKTMNNLPLHPLVWFELDSTNRLICEVVTPVCEYSVWKAVDSVAYSVLYYNRHTEAPTKEATGFATIDEAKAWAWNDYNEKMQPYVKPTPTWVDVSESLPEQNTEVLVRYHAHFDDEEIKEFDFCTAFFYRKSFDVKDQNFYTKRTTSVTHWMPIPEFSTMQNNKGE